MSRIACSFLAAAFMMGCGPSCSSATSLYNDECGLLDLMGAGFEVVNKKQYQLCLDLRATMRKACQE